MANGTTSSNQTSKQVDTFIYLRLLRFIVNSFNDDLAECSGDFLPDIIVQKKTKGLNKYFF